MSVSPLPRRGGVQFDARDGGRALRVAAHPESGSVVLSLWRDDVCIGTHQVAMADVPELLKVLVTALTDSAATDSVRAS